MNVMKTVAGVALAGAVLTGCVTNDGVTGTGPVTLNARQQAHFDEWRTNSINRDPLYFFLVRGGTSYYVYCPDTAALCRDSLEILSKQQCDARYGTDACKLYGVYGKVVWEFEKPADPNWSNGSRGHSSSAITKKDTRALSGNWKGEPFSGSMSYARSSAAYRIGVTIPGKTDCNGRAEFTRKTWTLSCRNGISASGSFTPLGEGEGSIGDGKDEDGNPITFRVWPALR